MSSSTSSACGTRTPSTPLGSAITSAKLSAPNLSTRMTRKREKKRMEKTSRMVKNTRTSPRLSTSYSAETPLPHQKILEAHPTTDHGDRTSHTTVPVMV
jgi:hypothetical protein